MNASRLPSPGRLMFDELLLQPNLRLRVGEHVVDVGALRIVTQPDAPRLTSKAVAVLLELARHAGDTVTRDALLDRVWADRVTTQDVLTQAIKELRRGFGDDARPSRYIETIPRVGYRLLAPVASVGAEPLVPAEQQPQAGNDARVDAAVEMSAAPLRATPAAAAPPSRWRLHAALLLGVVAVAAALALSWWSLRSRSGGPRAEAAWIATDARSLTSDPGSELRPALSPDGTRVAYAHLDGASGIDRLMMRSLGQSQSMRITAKSNEVEEAPMWSPDGSQIAFERLGADSCMVYIVPSLGGAEREVGRCHNYTTFYFDWTPDASALITAERGAGAATGMALLHWDLASGTKRPLHYQRTAADQDLEAHYSPDGSLIAFRRGLAPYSDLCVMAAAGGAVRQLTQLHSRIRGYAWTADGRGLVFASNHEGRFALYTVGLDSGAVRPLGVGPAEYPASERHGDSIVYEIPRTTNRLAWVRLGADRAVPELLAQSTGSDDSPALAPDGSRIAFISDRNGHPQIWLYDFAASAAMALTDFRDALLIGPTWSADGKRLLVTVRNSENPGLVEIDLATRRQRIVSAPGDDVLSGSYGVGDDDYLLVIGASSRHNTLVHLEHAGSASPRRTLLTSGIEHMEPDAHGGRVYYTKNARPGLFSLPLGGGEETLVTTLVDTSQIDGWRIVDGRIWYMSQVAWKPVDLIEFDPATGARRVLGHLQTELHDVAFSPTPARDRVVIVALGAEDTDIGAFRLRSGE